MPNPNPTTIEILQDVRTKTNIALLDIDQLRKVVCSIDAFISKAIKSLEVSSDE